MGPAFTRRRMRGTSMATTDKRCAAADGFTSQLALGLWSGSDEIDDVENIGERVMTSVTTHLAVMTVQVHS